ncbi:MAG: hypothetical protein EZS28_029883, partial [Streblomastix strix]
RLPHAGAGCCGAG